jgi:RNA methyltransferase, TrmH family
MISKNQIKYIQSLHSKKHRETETLFLAEGVKTCLEIIEQMPEMIDELFCLQSFLNDHERLLHEKKIKTTVTSNEDLKRISLLQTPNEVLCVCRQFSQSVPEINFENQFSFYLDGIRDPGNLGTIIRICNWFGIKELFCSEDTVELYNPKCIQSCMGAFLRVKLYYMPLNELISLKKIKDVFAADLNGTSIYESSKTAGLIVIGNEANGIQDSTKQLCNGFITIPSADKGMESLNAAVATAIIASEWFRKSV